MSETVKPFRPFKEPWKNFLQERKNQYDQRRYPGAYAVNGPERGKWEDETSNGLTRAVIDFLKYEGGAFTRVNVMGVPRKNKYGQTIMTPSTTVKGTADIVGTIAGLYMAVEIKIGSDSQSDEQKAEEARIKRAGGIYFVAKTFPGFLNTYNSYKIIIDEVDSFLQKLNNELSNNTYGV